LFIEGQERSYPNVMAQHKAVGGGEFKIPFMADNIGGFLLRKSNSQFPCDWLFSQEAQLLSCRAG
jgi:hypothetical protein